MLVVWYFRKIELRRVSLVFIYVFNGYAYLCVCSCEVVDQVPLAVDVEVVAHPTLVHQPLHTVLITVLLHTSFVDLQKVED